ncbi:mitochondrial fission 1 protein-like [Crotalus tigris]|uniref:mitochondrial fission 1 protein-like n=1 Tax=Crotalus tigris TaxID=88082 RepID=UPI00192F92CE|nr:mitochondrial fission 1 protein-like [Crotalus tigris]
MKHSREQSKILLYLQNHGDPPANCTVLRRSGTTIETIQIQDVHKLLLKGNKEEQRDYVFYLAVANYRLKEYEKALKYIRGLLKTEPSNTQALEMEKLIKKAMQKDGLVGMAIVGGMALGAASLAGLIGLAIAKSKS